MSAAYTAAHGHPAEHDTLVASESSRRRWSVGLRTALVAVVVLLVVAGVLVVRDLRTMSVEPVAVATVDAGGDAGTGVVGDVGRGGEAEGDAAAVGAGADGASGTGAAGGVTGGRSGQTPGAGGEGGTVLVHVVGQVNEPGVVEVAAGARVYDAVLAAGGMTAEADAASVNLARLVVDGEQVYVPVPGEDVPDLPGPEGSAGGTTDGGDTAGGTTGSGLVDVNTAGSEELQRLPGVGPALAQRILDWRAANGSFGSVDQLQDVSGIGPAVLEKLRALATV